MNGVRGMLVDRLFACPFENPQKNFNYCKKIIELLGEQLFDNKRNNAIVYLKQEVFIIFSGGRVLKHPF